MRPSVVVVPQCYVRVGLCAEILRRDRSAAEVFFSPSASLRSSSLPPPLAMSSASAAPATSTGSAVSAAAPAAAAAPVSSSFTPAAPSRSASSLSRSSTQWDRCLENGAIKTGYGAVVAGLASLLLFRKSGARAAGMGFGAGIGGQQTQTAADSSTKADRRMQKGEARGAGERGVSGSTLQNIALGKMRCALISLLCLLSPSLCYLCVCSQPEWRGWSASKPTVPHATRTR